MKKIITAFLITLFINVLVFSSTSYGQIDFFAQVEVQHCSTDDCSVTLEQWYSPTFNDAKWELVIDCGDVSGSWSGNGVYGGSACEGSISY